MFTITENDEIYRRALYKAIRYFGSQTKLANAIGIKQQTISSWLNRGQSIPYLQVLKIVHATKGVVSYHELAPEQAEFNHILDNMVHSKFSRLICVPIDRIKESSQLCLHGQDLITGDTKVREKILNQPLLIYENFQLVHCACSLRLHRSLGHTKVYVKMMCD